MQTIKKICDRFLLMICSFFAFVYESDYRMAYIAFFMFWYHLITHNERILSDIFLFEICIGLFIIRKMNEISDRIDAFYKIFNGSQIKRIEMEVISERQETKDTN